MCSVLELKTDGHYALRTRSEPPHAAAAVRNVSERFSDGMNLRSNAACVTVLPPRFKENHGDGVGKVHTPAAEIASAGGFFLRGGQAVEDVGRQPARFLPNSKRRLLKRGFIGARRAFGGQGENTSVCQRLEAVVEVFVHRQAGEFVVVEPGAFHFGGINGKPSGLTRCKSAPVLAHRRMMLPVFGGFPADIKRW